MEAITLGLERVAAMERIVGCARLAAEAGLPESTVRSFRERGWVLKSLPNCEKLIAAAERLERGQFTAKEEVRLAEETWNGLKRRGRRLEKSANAAEG
ncbi:MAG TPA: hypothetical protein VGG68_00875 [Caulobacteraceae bacterium]|jgi:hypothetical protein